MKKRVLVLVHIDLIPPSVIDTKVDNSYEPWITEFDVISTLKESGHDVSVLGVYDELAVIRKRVEEFKPHIIFNLLEEFDGNVLMDQHIVSFLELLKIKYTGCSPRGLMLSRDKSLTKKILSYHRIATPKFQVIKSQIGKKLKSVRIKKGLKYPLIVKCLNEDASLGLSNSSIVKSEEKAIERVRYLFDKYKTDVIVEEFIAGKEIYVGVIGNKRLEVLPILELHFDNAQKPELEIYSERAKWSKKHRDNKGVRVATTEINSSIQEKIIRMCKKSYQVLNLDGVARIDFRISEEGVPYIIEVNANPNLALEDEFAISWMRTGKSYPALIDKLVSLGLRR